MPIKAKIKNNMSKLISLKKAISEFVKDGDIVYAAGFTHLIPFAAGDRKSVV